MARTSIGEGPTAISLTPNFDRAMDWVFDREGGFQKNPKDRGNYYLGELIGTNFGISAASWAWKYDIPNLTKDQAREIYFEHYWLASGANELRWPLSLLVFDTAVLHGVSAAKAWLEEVGPNPYWFAAKRLSVYTNSPSEWWDEFGRGSVNRVILLLKEMA